VLGSLETLKRWHYGALGVLYPWRKPYIHQFARHSVCSKTSRNSRCNRCFSLLKNAKI